MKHSLLAVVLTLGSLSATAAFAQAPVPETAQQPVRHMHRMHNPHKQAMRMGKRLGLNSDQTARLEPILAQRKQQADSIQQNASLSPDQKHAQLRDLKRNTHQQIAGILTPEQMQQMKAMHKGHHGKQASGAAPTGA